MPTFSKAVFIFFGMVAGLGVAENTVATDMNEQLEGNTKRNLRGLDSDEKNVEAMNETHRSLISYKDVTIWEGNWGGWKSWVSGDNDRYACGAEIRLEGRGGDDTAANGLRLKFCKLSDWDSWAEKSIYNGLWGDWKGMVMCPKNKWISGGEVRFEDRQGSGDDTALNGLKIWCADKTGNNGEWKTVNSGYWGEWKTTVMKPGMLVHAARVRFENNQYLLDDTAWNGLEFKMVPHDDREYEDVYLINGVHGDWKGWKGADKAGMYACGAQVRFEEDQGAGDDTAANGLRLQFCHIDDWERQVRKSIYDGVWGDWGPKMVMCPKDTWITGVRVRYEPSYSVTANFDGTAMNGLDIYCSPREGAGNGERIEVEEGIWGGWYEKKREGKFIKEANIQFEDPIAGDDTAWNGLKFRMETPHSD